MREASDVWPGAFSEHRFGVIIGEARHGFGQQRPPVIVGSFYESLESEPSEHITECIAIQAPAELRNSVFWAPPNAEKRSELLELLRERMRAQS